MVMSVMPIRWLTSACWLVLGRSSIRVSPVAVWAGLRLATNNRLENKTSRETRRIEISFLLPKHGRYNHDLGIAN
jgi:hypothetical protein